MDTFNARDAARAHKALLMSGYSVGEAGDMMKAALGQLAREREQGGFYGPGYKSAFHDYIRKGLGGMKDAAIKTLHEGQDTAGGFLVPPSLLQEIAQRLASAGVVPFLSRHQTITNTDMANLPRFVGSDDGYPTATRFAVTGAWSALDPPAVTDVRTGPTVGLSKVPIYTLIASILMSRNLLEDSGLADIDSVFAQLAVETQSAAIENYALVGTGQGQPPGILSNVQASGDTTSTVLSVKSGNASALTGDGIANLFGSLPAQYIPRARWVMHPTTMQAVMELKDSQNRPLLTFEGDSGFIYGRPVILSAFMPTIAAGAYPLIFGDLAGQHWVTREELAITRHDESVAELNQVLLKMRFRAGSAVAEPYRFRAQLVSA